MQSFTRCKLVFIANLAANSYVVVERCLQKDNFRKICTFGYLVGIEEADTGFTKSTSCNTFDQNLIILLLYGIYLYSIV